MGSGSSLNVESLDGIFFIEREETFDGREKVIILLHTLFGLFIHGCKYFLIFAET
jgi:hypothetical protein